MFLPDSLADVEDLVGFFSYAREDDDDSDGTLSNIRDRIQKELRQLLGRRKASGFKVWQDKTAISYGKLWELEIRRAVQESVFFVPIITPTAIKSHYCKFEFDLFLKREAQLHRSDLIFPILYIRVPDLENEALWRRSELLTIVGERQFADWREFRQLKLQDEKEFRIAVEKFCNNIADTLRRPLTKEATKGLASVPSDSGSIKATPKLDASAPLVTARAKHDSPVGLRPPAQDHRSVWEELTRRQIRSAIAIGAALIGALVCISLVVTLTTAPTTPPQATVGKMTVLTPAAERLLKPKDTFRECDRCPEMIVVPAGIFTMGSPSDEKGHTPAEEPQHTVTLPVKFAVGRFAVTFDEWDTCVALGGCKHRPDDQRWGRVNRPVINVSWHDAQEYVSWLSATTKKTYRLLSESEREYVTRAGTTTPFWWGRTISTQQANYDGRYVYGDGSKGDWRQKTVPVDTFPANEWGLYQVHGNIWEWVQDCFYPEAYRKAPTDGSAYVGIECASRVQRGGSWEDSPNYARSASRWTEVPEDRSSTAGLRVARTLTP